MNQKTSSKANLCYATHRGKRSSTCVAMVRSSIHVARPTSSFVTGAAAALATFSCAFTRKAYELTTHFRVQPNGKGQGLIGDIPLQLSGVGNILLQFTILEIYHHDISLSSLGPSVMYSFPEFSRIVIFTPLSIHLLPCTVDPS